MSGAVEHILAAERLLRHVENMYADDPQVETALRKADIHTRLAQVIMQLPSEPTISPDVARELLVQESAELLGAPGAAVETLLQPWGTW